LRTLHTQHTSHLQHTAVLTGFDGVYVPLLVDDLEAFLAAFEGHDFAGFSVTIPHKEAALKVGPRCREVACDPASPSGGVGRHQAGVAKWLWVPQKLHTALESPWFIISLR